MKPMYNIVKMAHKNHSCNPKKYNQSPYIHKEIPCQYCMKKLIKCKCNPECQIKIDDECTQHSIMHEQFHHYI